MGGMGNREISGSGAVNRQTMEGGREGGAWCGAPAAAEKKSSPTGAERKQLSKFSSSI